MALQDEALFNETIKRAQELLQKLKNKIYALPFFGFQIKYFYEVEDLFTYFEVTSISYDRGVKSDSFNEIILMDSTKTTLKIYDRYNLNGSRGGNPLVQIGDRILFGCPIACKQFTMRGRGIITEQLTYLENQWENAFEEIKRIYVK